MILIKLAIIVALCFLCQMKEAALWLSVTQAVKSSEAQKCHFKDNFMKIGNNTSVLEINLNGGSITDFHLKELPINPLNWRSRDTTMPPFMGHFLCFDRWGPPSEGEKANGLLHHGEVNTLVWDVLTEPGEINGRLTCSMTCTLPVGGLKLTRKIEMSEDEPLFFVTEEITNLNKHGRIYNIVQHVTLGPPFLDTTTLFDNNAGRGFENKENGSPDQEEPVLRWPEAYHDGEKISLRQFLSEWPRVSSFVFNRNDRYGWVTACNPDKRVMIGYIWETEDYPWINFWRSMENNTPVAFGMEFGTTGLHEPFPVLAKKARIFDRNIYDFIDAGEVITKSYTAFLAEIPDDYKGVDKIDMSGSLITIKEMRTVSRDIMYHPADHNR